MSYHFSPCFCKSLKFTSLHYIFFSANTFVVLNYQIDTGSSSLTRREISREIKCVHCDKVKFKGESDKFRVSEKLRAEQFLKAIRYFKDDRSVRLADIDNVESLLAADIYSHKECMNSYLKKYEYETSNCCLCGEKCRRSGFYTSINFEAAVAILASARQRDDAAVENVFSSSIDGEQRSMLQSIKAHISCLNSYLSDGACATENSCFTESLLPLIDDMLRDKFGLTISEINEYLSGKWPNVTFYSHHIKEFIVQEYGDQITFCNPYRKYESEVVFPASISPSDIVQKIQVHDSVKYTGKMLRETLKTVDFGLHDIICDKASLHNSYYRTKIPEVFMTFMSSLLHIPKAKLMTEKENFDGTSDIESDGEADEQMEQSDIALGNRYNRKILEINGLFETMYNMVHRARKRTPLQTMVGHSVYDRSHSRELVTSLNRLGWSINYNAILSDRSKLGANAITKSQEGNVPLPGHFNTTDFVMGAFDNFDHSDQSTLIGPKDSHDTALVLYQNHVSPSEPKSKVSELKVEIRSRKYIEELHCQKIRSYPYSKRLMPLPKEFQTKKFHYESDNSERVTSFLRIGAFEEDLQSQVPTWAGIHSLTSKKGTNIVKKEIGFLPFIMHPITEIETVYTCILNFRKIASNLEQKFLPVACDEGVYHLVTKIYLDRPELFDNVFFMLGSFHTAKTALKCAGKYIRGSGVSDAMIECGLFGPKSVETVLNGSHYYRSFNGIIMLAEAIERLRYEAFWKQADHSSFNELEEMFPRLLTSLSDVDGELSKCILDQIMESSQLELFLSSIDQFSELCCQTSEQCKFWIGFLKIVDMIKNLVRADREGDFPLHMKAMQDLCPVFLGCGSINYQRYGTFYLEQLKNLKFKMPELYQSFMKGDFVVRRTNGNFCAVAADMALEQTIQRSAKSTRGIIGKTKCQNYVSEWALINHEILGISNKFRSVTRADRGGNNETTVHHQLQKSKINSVNKSVAKLKSFIEVRGNPFCPKECEKNPRLKNFVTQQLSNELVAKSRTMFHENSNTAFKLYHKEVYVDKTNTLLDKISKAILNPLDYYPKEKQGESDQKSKHSDKFQRAALKSLLVAKDKGDNMKMILKHDVTTFNYLYDRDYLTKPDKSQIVDEIKTIALQDVDVTLKPLLHVNCQ